MTCQTISSEDILRSCGRAGFVNGQGQNSDKAFKDGASQAKKVALPHRKSSGRAKPIFIAYRLAANWTAAAALLGRGEDKAGDFHGKPSPPACGENLRIFFNP